MGTKARSGSVSVVVPAYNEASCIERTVTDIHRFLSGNFREFEIIVVDDGSTDDTYNIASGFSEKIENLRVLRNGKNCGKGYSVKRGVLEAGLRYIAFTDCDLSTPIFELTKLTACLDGGADIAIGSRALAESRILKKQSALRRNMGKAFNLLVRTFLFRGIRDTQCGFKCFKKDAARELFKAQLLNGFCFDAEILYLAKKRGLTVREIPIQWMNRADSRVSMIGGPVEMILGLLRIGINERRGRYEAK